MGGQKFCVVGLRRTIGQANYQYVAKAASAAPCEGQWPRVYTAPHPRAVSKEAKDGVLHALALSAVDGEETTTEAVCEMFAAQGVTPSTSFVRSFLHNNNQSLHTVIPRSSYEIDDSNQVEGQIQTLWPTFAPSICPGSAGSL